MLFGKRGKSGLVALNLDIAQVAIFVKERLGKEVIVSFLCFICIVDKLFFSCLVQLVESFLTVENLYLPFFHFTSFGLQVEMSGCKGPITTFIVEPFIPHNEEFYLNIVSDRLGNSISFSECGGIEIEENWDKVILCASLYYVMSSL